MESFTLTNLQVRVAAVACDVLRRNKGAEGCRFMLEHEGKKYYLQCLVQDGMLNFNTQLQEAK